MTAIASQVEGYLYHDPLPKNTPVHQEEKIVHLAGKTLAGMGAFTAAGVAGIAFGVVPISGGACFTILACAVGATGSIAMVYFGINLIQKKEFWNDPNYILSVRKEIIQFLFDHKYNATQSKFKELWEEHPQLISTKTIGDIILNKFYQPNEPGFIDRVKDDQENSLNQLIEHQIFPENFLLEYYQREIQELGILEFIKLRGVVFNTPWFSPKTEINGKTLRAHFRESIKPLNLTLLLKFCSLDDLDELIKLELITVEELQNKWKPLQHYFTRFTSLFVSFKSLRASLFDDRLLKIISRSEIHHLIITEFQCFAFDFASMLSLYKWELFRAEFVSAEDEVVGKAFCQYLKKMSSITDFFKNGYQKAKEFSLLTPAILGEPLSLLVEKLYEKYSGGNEQQAQGKKEINEINNRIHEVQSEYSQAATKAANAEWLAGTFTQLNSPIGQYSVNQGYQNRMAGVGRQLQQFQNGAERTQSTLLDSLNRVGKGGLSLINIQWRNSLKHLAQVEEIKNKMEAAQNPDEKQGYHQKYQNALRLFEVTLDL